MASVNPGGFTLPRLACDTETRFAVTRVQRKARNRDIHAAWNLFANIVANVLTPFSNELSLVLRVSYSTSSCFCQSQFTTALTRQARRQSSLRETNYGVFASTSAPVTFRATVDSLKTKNSWLGPYIDTVCLPDTTTTKQPRRGQHDEPREGPCGSVEGKSAGSPNVSRSA